MLDKCEITPHFITLHVYFLFLLRRREEFPLPFHKVVNYKGTLNQQFHKLKISKTLFEIGTWINTVLCLEVIVIHFNLIILIFQETQH